MKVFIYLLLIFVSKMTAALFMLKFFGMFLTPADFGKFTQYMAFMAVVFSLPLLGAGNYLTKELSGVRNINEWGFIVNKIIGFFITSIVFFGFTIFFLKSYIDKYVFMSDQGYAIYFYIYLAFILNCISTFFYSAASARSELQLVSIASFLGCVLYVLSVYPIYFKYGYIGLYFALPLLYIYPAFFMILFLSRFLVGFKIKAIFDLKFHIDALKYGLLIVVGVFSLPLISVLIRHLFSNAYGWDELGSWQAAVKISDTIQQLLGLFLSYFLLPYFVKNKYLLSVRNLFYFILFYFIISIVVVFLFRFLSSFFIVILFGSDYLSATKYSYYYIVGDVFRALSLFIVFYFLSVGKLKVVFGYEVAQGLIYYFLVSFFLLKSEMVVAWVYLFTYVLCALFLLFYFSIKVFKERL